MFSFISVAAANVCFGLSVLLSLSQCKNFHMKNHPSFYYARAILVFFMVILLLLPFSNSYGESFDRFLKEISKLLIFIPVMVSITKISQLMRIFSCLMFSIFVSDLYIFWQGIHGDFRAAGFFSHPMYFAGLAVQFLPILFLAIYYKKINTRYMKGLLLTSSIALLINGTRGAWGAVVLTGLMLIYLYYRSLKKICAYGVVIMMFFASAIYVVPSIHSRMDTVGNMEYQSNSERLLMWQSAWNMFKDHPIIGVGVGRYQDYYQSEYILPEAKERGQGHPHNNIMIFLAETGIVGCTAFLFMFGSFLYYSLKDWLVNKNISALMFFSATIGVFLQGLTETNFGNSIVMTFYYFIMALSIKFSALRNK